MWHADAVSTFQITFVGPAALAVQIATMLADAPGVELTSSEPPVARDPDTVELEVEVEGSQADVAAAVAAIRAEMPDTARIELVGG